MGKAIAFLTVLVVCSFAFVLLQLSLRRNPHRAAAAEEGHRAIASVLPPLMAETLGPAEYEPMRQKLLQLPPPPPRPTLGRQEWLGALAVFLWVFVMTLPVALPLVASVTSPSALRVGRPAPSMSRMVLIRRLSAS